MSSIKRMYQILEHMVEFAEKSDFEGVFMMNRAYHANFWKVVYHDPTMRNGEYERCRAACIMSAYLPAREKNIMDARKSLGLIRRLTPV